MNGQRLIPMLCAVCLVGAVVRADVTLQTSATGVQKGGDLTFTATTDETDPIVKVTFSYEGTAATDEDTTAPYQVTRTMDWQTGQDLTVTATIDYANIADQQDTVDVDVVDIALFGPSTPLRSAGATYLARTDPTGLSVSSWSWTYDYNDQLSDTTWTDTTNSDQYSAWRGNMVLSGTVSVSASLLGVTCTNSMTATVAQRSGPTWSTLGSCVEDNEPNWGANLLGMGEPMGEIRDKDSNIWRIIVPQTSEDDWTDGVTVRQASGGPNDGLWYVVGNTLEIDLETVINKFAKSGGPPPEPGATNFYDYNNAAGNCIAADMADFIQALKNHEYRGTPSTAKSLEGHFGRIEYALDLTGDPAQAIEDHAATSQAALISSVNTTIGAIEDSLKLFTAHGTWSDAGPNWGGTGSLGSGTCTEYDIDNSRYYSGCYYGPSHF